MTIGVLFASSPEELIASNKYRCHTIMIPIDFTDTGKPFLRYFSDIGLREIAQMVSTTEIILQVEDDDPINIENICLEGFAYKIASTQKEVLEQIHVECRSISLGLIECNGHVYIDEDSQFIEFLILSMQLTTRQRISNYRSEYPYMAFYIGEAANKKDIDMSVFWEFDGVIVRKPELLKYLDPELAEYLDQIN